MGLHSRWGSLRGAVISDPRHTHTRRNWVSALQHLAAGTRPIHHRLWQRPAPAPATPTATGPGTGVLDLTEVSSTPLFRPSSCLLEIMRFADMETIQTSAQRQQQPSHCAFSKGHSTPGTPTTRGHAQARTSAGPGPLQRQNAHTSGLCGFGQVT